MCKGFFVYCNYFVWLPALWTALSDGSVGYNKDSYIPMTSHTSPSNTQYTRRSSSWQRRTCWHSPAGSRNKYSNNWRSEQVQGRTYSNTFLLAWILLSIFPAITLNPWQQLVTSFNKSSTSIIVPSL